MASSNHLFQLIHSLTQSEKRYFKIFSSFQSGSKVYIKLFDAIAKQKHYDENKLKEKLNITAFATAKTYLYSLIMRSLRSQQQNQNVSLELKDLLKDIEILFLKGLYGQSYKLLVKAKKLAQMHEKFPFLMEIYQLEHMVANVSVNTAHYKRLFQSGHSEAIDTIAAYKEQMEYRKIINLLTYKRSLRGKVIREEIEKKEVYQQAHLLLNKKPETLLSYKAAIFHYNINEQYYYSINDLEGAYKNCKDAIRFQEANPTLMMEDLNNYKNAVNNLMNVQMLLRKYEEIKSWIDKLRTLPATTLTEKAKIFSCCAGKEIVYFTYTGRHKEGLEAVSLIEKQLALYEHKIPKPTYFVTCANVEELFIVCGNFKQALFWNNKILNDPQIESFYDCYSNSRMSEIIIHYELENIEKLQSLIKSYQLFLSNCKGKYKYENSFINFFKNVLNIVDKKELEKEFIRYHKELLKYTKDPYESEAFDLIDLASWLESKIENRPFATIMKEKIWKSS